MKKAVKIATLVAMTMAGLAMWNSSVAADQKEGKRKGPPQEAFDACANQSEQAACSFTSPRGEASGQCVVPPHDEDSPLVCKPEGMGGHKHKPEQEG